MAAIVDRPEVWTAMAMLVRHVMTEAPRSLNEDMSAADAAGIMRSFDVGVVPVVRDDELVGLVTDRDLVVRVVADRQDPSAIRLGDIATASPVTVSPDAKLSEARELMASHRVRRLPVLKSGELVGILSLGDLALSDRSERAVGEALEEISRSDSTETVNDGGPDPGTPDRVRDATRSDATS
jgi:CBS domain-containing protein